MFISESKHRILVKETVDLESIPGTLSVRREYSLDRREGGVWDVIHYEETHLHTR